MGGGVHSLQTCSSHLKTLGGRTATRNKLPTQAPTDITRHRSKISHRGDMAPRICPSVLHTVNAYSFYSNYTRNVRVGDEDRDSNWIL